MRPDADRIIDLEGGTLVPGVPRCARAPSGHRALRAGHRLQRGAKVRNADPRRFPPGGRGGGAVLFGGNFEDPLDRPHDPQISTMRWGTAGAAHQGGHALVHRVDRAPEPAGSERPEGVDRGRRADEPTGYLREQAARDRVDDWFENNLPREQQIEAIRAAARPRLLQGRYVGARDVRGRVARVAARSTSSWRRWSPWPSSSSLSRDDRGRSGEGTGSRSIGGDWFLDGSFGSHTAWMKEPFTSSPSRAHPDEVSATGAMRRYATSSPRRSRRGCRWACMRSETPRSTGCLGVGEGRRQVGCRRGSRRSATAHRALRVRESTITSHASAALGLRASVQPAFDAFWGGEDGLYSERIGWDRARHMNRFRSMLDAGCGWGPDRIRRSLRSIRSCR